METHEASVITGKVSCSNACQSAKVSPSHAPDGREYSLRRSIVRQVGTRGVVPSASFEVLLGRSALAPRRSDLDILVTRQSHEAASTINALYAADWTDSAPLLAAALVSYASLVATT